MATLDNKIENQVNLSKNGIYEVFVNEGELREYWGIDGDKESPLMKKMFVAVFAGETCGLSFERGRAIGNLFEAAEVESFEELENL